MLVPFSLPVQTNLSAAWVQGHKSGSRSREGSECRGQKKGAGTIGYSGAQAGWEGLRTPGRRGGGPGCPEHTQSRSALPGAAGLCPGIRTLVPDTPAPASREAPWPRPPPQVGRPRQPISKTPGHGGGACLAGSDAFRSAGPAVPRSSVVAVEPAEGKMARTAAAATTLAAVEAEARAA